MSVISQFIRGGSDPNEQYLDKAAFNKFAREVKAKSLGRTPSDDAKSVDGINRMLSSIAGVAELNNIEADFEVLNILRDSLPLDFAEMRPLPLGALPLYRAKSLNAVGVFLGSVNGGGGYTYYANKEFGVQVFPYVISTEKIMIPNLNNIYDMVKLAERKDGLERLDHFQQMGVHNACVNTMLANPSLVSVVTDDPAVNVLNYAATGGSFAGKNVYTLDPGVIAAGVPTVNYFDLTTEGGLTKKVFQTVNTFAIQSQRRMIKMYIPQAAAAGKAPVWESLQNLATPVALVTGQVGSADPAKAIPSEMWSEFQKDDFRGAVMVNWFGLSIEVSKQNWLPAGYVLVLSDQPTIIMWDRMSLATGSPSEGTLESPANGFYNYRSTSRQIATVRPDYCLRNWLLVKVQ